MELIRPYFKFKIFIWKSFWIVAAFIFVFGLSVNVVKLFGSIPEALRSSSIWQLTILDEIVCLLAIFGNFTFAVSKSYTLINVLYTFFNFLPRWQHFFWTKPSDIYFPEETLARLFIHEGLWMNIVENYLWKLQF